VGVLLVGWLVSRRLICHHPPPFQPYLEGIFHHHCPLPKYLFLPDLSSMLICLHVECAPLRPSRQINESKKFQNQPHLDLDHDVRRRSLSQRNQNHAIRVGNIRSDDTPSRGLRPCPSVRRSLHTRGIRKPRRSILLRCQPDINQTLSILSKFGGGGDGHYSHGTHCLLGIAAIS